MLFSRFCLAVGYFCAEVCDAGFGAVSRFAACFLFRVASGFVCSVFLGSLCFQLRFPVLEVGFVDALFF